MAAQAPVTTVFRRTIRAGYEERYENWLSGIARTAARFPGSQGTTVLRPTGEGSEYVVLTQFESAESLEAWRSSPERGAWISRLRANEVCDEDVSTLAGLERWFALAPGSRARPPRHKTAALILLGLYPLVLVLDVVLAPLLSGLPRPVGLLASLLVSVSAMVGFVLPWLTRVFAGWLHPTGRCPRLRARSSGALPLRTARAGEPSGSASKRDDPPAERACDGPAERENSRRP